MFFIRLAFWLGLIVLLLPTDERQQARLYNTAVATVESATTFCERNPGTCAAGSDFWAMFVKKAEFGARIAMDLVSKGGRKDEAIVPTPARVVPERGAGMPESRLQPMARGTLTPADLTPAWRGQLHRTGT
jgi:hypothetical protein